MLRGLLRGRDWGSGYFWCPKKMIILSISWSSILWLFLKGRVFGSFFQISMTLERIFFYLWFCCPSDFLYYFYYSALILGYHLDVLKKPRHPNVLSLLWRYLSFFRFLLSFSTLRNKYNAWFNVWLKVLYKKICGIILQKFA